MIGLLLSPLGRIGLGALGIGVFLAMFALDQRARERVRVVTKIERQTNAAVKEADGAGAKSRSKSHGGVRDPHTID
jgi:hypothetical protein